MVQEAYYGEDLFIDILSSRIHYVETGEGPPLFLLPGAFGTYKIWNRVLPYLINSFSIVALDCIGMGDSQKPLSGFGYTVGEQAQVMAGMIEELYPCSVNLAGVAEGGEIAMHLALHYPELVENAICIESLFLKGEEQPPNPYESFLKYPVISHLFALFMKMGFFNSTVMELMTEDWFLEMDPGEREEVQEIVAHQCKKVHRQSWYQIICAQNQHQEEEIEFPPLTVPVLYLYGKCSSFIEYVQKNLEFLQRDLPQVEICSFVDGIHHLQLQKPREVAREMKDFIFQRRRQRDAELAEILGFSSLPQEGRR